MFKNIRLIPNRYKLDNGSIFRGRAHRLNFDYVHVYLMVGADDIIYWVKIDDFDLENDKPFSKIVRLGKVGIFFFTWIFSIKNSAFPWYNDEKMGLNFAFICFNIFLIWKLQFDFALHFIWMMKLIQKL